MFCELVIFFTSYPQPITSTIEMASQTSLRPGEIKDILLREIEAADLSSLDVEEVGTVLEVKDGDVTAAYFERDAPKPKEE